MPSDDEAGRESSRRGMAAMRDTMARRPRVDSYERKVDIRAQVMRDDEERRRRWR